ncbi:hypothetical protein [Rhodococcus erythropolis]|uniref:hypothetical protein n=1 Tax=Rhodococcus erythropolis TaxID=1833 RepID=UPI002227B3EE|nr:hypothetical protein [Rhodococcus erythropolis]MCW2298108.1 hypothetical protein [Rhodococcus erythropolis]
MTSAGSARAAATNEVVCTAVENAVWACSTTTESVTVLTVTASDSSAAAASAGSVPVQ